MTFPRYPAYKNSGVEWFGEVPEHWAALRLRFAATLNPSKQEAKSYADDELVSFLPMEAIGEDGSLSLVQEKEVGECLNGYTYFTDGDVCIAKITPCFENGKGAIFRGLKGGIGFGTTELIVARPKAELLTAEFLDYLFRSNPFRTLGEAAMYGAGGQKRVPDAFVRDFSAFLPPLTEQQLIASFLDHETAKIDALVSEQQRLIELLQEKRQAVISHAVTKGLNPNAPMKDSGVEWLGEVPEHWGVRRLRYIGTLQNGLNIGAEAFGEGDPFVSYGDVYNNPNIPSQPAGLVRSTPDDKRKYGLEKGDALFTRTSETVDDIGVASACLEPVLHSTFAGFLIRLRPFQGVLEPRYSTHLFRNRGVKNHFAGTLNMVTRASLSQGELGDLPICIPPLEEQLEIAIYIEEMTEKSDHLISSARNLVSLLQERRSALISAAVTGQIDVRGLVPEAAEQ